MTIQPPSNPFSTRELEVISLLLQGKANKEIALALGITERTVESHLGSIYSKLGVTSRTSAVIKLHEQPLWISTGSNDATHQGNPQLKNDRDGAILSPKVRFLVYRSRRFRTKNLVRIIILILLAILLVVIITAIFAYLRQV